MGFWGNVINRNKEIVPLDDLNLYKDYESNAAFKRIAIESVIGFIARIIIQSEIRIKKNDKYIKDSAYYQLNVKPNKNQTAAKFWHDVIHRLIYDGELLVIRSREGDLLIADDFHKREYAVREDRFNDIYVRGMKLDGTFKRSEVIYMEYGNEELSKLVDSLFSEYGDLIGRMFETQKMKNQIRSTVSVESSNLKNEEGIKALQNFINKSYEAIKNKSIAIVPQQKGMEYEEHSKQGSSGQSVDEVNKTTDGFLDQVCHSVGLPPNLLKGDMADVENMTRNAMKFCIDPILKIISDELNSTLISKSSYLKGERITIKRISYRDLFDVAEAVDKLRSSSVVDGHELRDELGMEHSDDPIHSEFIMTKNYEGAQGGDKKGGEKET